MSPSTHVTIDHHKFGGFWSRLLRYQHSWICKALCISQIRSNSTMPPIRVWSQRRSGIIAPAAITQDKFVSIDPEDINPRGERGVDEGIKIWPHPPSSLGIFLAVPATEYQALFGFQYLTMIVGVTFCTGLSFKWFFIDIFSELRFGDQHTLNSYRDCLIRWF